MKCRINLNYLIMSTLNTSIDVEREKCRAEIRNSLEGQV
jgi:hypothetical protein